MKFSNKHDQQRADKIKQTLAKAGELLEEAKLYLAANNRPLEEINAVDDAHWYVLIALERLGVQTE